VWFIVAVMMIATSGGFPFNMGWWGFIFPVGKNSTHPVHHVMLCHVVLDRVKLPSNPMRTLRTKLTQEQTVGVFTLLTITLGEELASKFFRVLSCVGVLSICLFIYAFFWFFLPFHKISSIHQPAHPSLRYIYTLHKRAYTSNNSTHFYILRY
jgi:tellurite resistance protein TehA-like permease